MGGILAYRDLAAQAAKLPGRRRAPLLRQWIRRCEARQELPGERAAGGPAEHVVAAARVRSLEVQPGAHDAASGPVDELHLAAADGLHDADVGKPSPVGVAEEHQVAWARPAPQGPARLRKAVQIRDPVLSRPWRKGAQVDALPRIDGAHEAGAVVGRAARQLARPPAGQASGWPRSNLAAKPPSSAAATFVAPCRASPACSPGEGPPRPWEYSLSRPSRNRRATPKGLPGR